VRGESRPTLRKLRERVGQPVESISQTETSAPRRSYDSRAVGMAKAHVNDEEQMQRFFQRLMARPAGTLETAHEFCAAARALTQDVPLPERPICKLAHVDEPKIAGRGHGVIAVQSAGLRGDDGHG